MNYPQEAAGIEGQSVAPKCFCSGVQIRIRLDSLKHAGMTDFGLAIFFDAASYRE
jgi:hypothetical protein